MKYWVDRFLKRLDEARGHKGNRATARRAFGLGEAYAARKQWRQALTCYEKSHRLNPYDFETRLGLCRALLRTGEASQALVAARKCRSQAPRRREPRRLEFEALIQLKALDEAAKALRGAMNANVLNAAMVSRHTIQLWTAMRKQDRASEAIPFLLEALQRATIDDTEIRKALIGCLIEYDRQFLIDLPAPFQPKDTPPRETSVSVRRLQDWLGLRLKTSRALDNATTKQDARSMYVSLKSTDRAAGGRDFDSSALRVKARDHLLVGLHREPDNVQLLGLLFDHYFGAYEFSRSRQVLDRLISDHGASPQRFEAQFKIFIYEQKPLEALKLGEEAICEHPERSKGYELRARALQAMGRLASAENAIRKASEMAVTNVGLKKRYVQAQLAAGHLNALNLGVGAEDDGPPDAGRHAALLVAARSHQDKKPRFDQTFLFVQQDSSSASSVAVTPATQDIKMTGVSTVTALDELRAQLRSLPDDGWVTLARTSEASLLTALEDGARQTIGYIYVAPLGDEDAARPPVWKSLAIALRTQDLQALLWIGTQIANLGDLLAEIDQRLIGQHAAIPTPVSAISNIPALTGDNEPGDVDRGSLQLQWSERAAVRASDILSPPPEPLSLNELRGGLLKDDNAAAVVDWHDFDAFDVLEGLRQPVFLMCEGLGELARETLASNAETRKRFGKLLRRATCVIVTDLAVEEWLEDTFDYATFVNASVQEGLIRATKAAGKRILIAVGSGLGNILQTTPMITHVSTELGVPVDILVNGWIPKAVEVFGECPFVNAAFDVQVGTAERPYDMTFITSSFGADIPFINSRFLFNQRYVFDFMRETYKRSEVAYNFLGVTQAFGGKVSQHGDTSKLFLRGYIEPPKFGNANLGRRAIVGICNSKKDEYWTNREWPYFGKLAKTLQGHGIEVRSFGLPHEAIDDTIDQTGTSLRLTIRRLTECDVFASADGGLFHLSEAIGLPTVVVFGPTSVLKNGPVRNSTLLLHSRMACSPCQFESDFLQCKTASCVIEVPLDEMRDTIFAALGWRDDPRQYANGDIIRHEVMHRKRPPRKMLKPKFLEESLDYLADPKFNWWEFFTANLHFKHFDRARQILDWMQACLPGETRVALGRAELAYQQDRNEDCVAMCELALVKTDETAKWLKWLFRALSRQKRWDVIVAWWERFHSQTSYLPSDKLHADLANLAARAYFWLGEKETAKDTWIQAIDLSPGFQPARNELESLSDTVYRLPQHRGPLAEKVRLQVALIAPHAVRCATLVKFRRDVDVYWFRPDEVINLEPSEFQLICEYHQSEEPVSIAKTIRGLRDWRSLKKQITDDGKWRHFVKFAKADGGSADPDKIGLQEWLEERLGENGEHPPRPRIMIAAHHHLTRWRPHGGELSTLGILRELERRGYEVLVVVENKKNYEIGCEIENDIPFVIGGRYAFEDVCKGVITCYQPDLVLMYGAASLRAFEACRSLGVPYILFPRDWKEVTTAPFEGLMKRPAILDENDVYHKMYHSAQAVITNAKYVSRVIKQLYGTESITAYVPVDPAENSPDSPRSSGQYITLINPRKQKGGELIRGLAYRHPDWAFKVIGSDDLPFPVNVRVEPFHTGPYAEMYQDASVALYAVGEREPCGTGRVVFEALYCKVPTISNDISANSEVLPKRWLVKDDNIEDWSRAIQSVLTENISNEYFETLIAPFEMQRQLDIVIDTVADAINA